MVRFSVEGEDWILRFSPHIQIGKEEKKAIINSLLRLGKGLVTYPHGSSFIIFKEEAFVFVVERVPSLILTLAAIIRKEHWYRLES